jgi:hypothetical protein
MLKRGKINTETEYYLSAAILADVSSLATGEERALLAQLVASYEREA